MGETTVTGVGYLHLQEPVRLAFARTADFVCNAHGQQGH